MRFFRNLARLLAPNNVAVHPIEVERDLAQAYQRVFSGSPTAEDQNAVLVDLADYTGFYRVTSPAVGADRDLIVFNEGMRAGYGRIFRFLRMSNEEMASLETAARETAALRNQALASNQMEG